MTTVTVQILKNINLDERGRRTGWDGYRPEDRLLRVFEYEVATDAAPRLVCENAYNMFNSDPHSLPDPTEVALATAYRSTRAESLSVGDVVVVGEVAFTCARYGWENVRVTATQISAPPVLDDAFTHVAFIKHEVPELN